MALWPTTTVLWCSAWAALAWGSVAARAQALARPEGVPPRSASPRHFEDISGDLPGEAITTVAASPDDPDTLYAGTDGFLFRTDDGGDTWRPVLSFPRGVAIDDTELDVADVADDAADTPFDDVPGRGFGSMADDLGADDEGDPESSGGARASGGFELGQYDVLNDPMPEGDLADQLTDLVLVARVGAGVRRVAFVPGIRGAFLVATPRGLYRTSNAGVSFERLALPEGVRANDVRDVAVDPMRPTRVYAATAAGLVTSADGGASLRIVPGRVGRVPATAVAVERTPHGDTVVVGTERGMLRSVDGGTSFMEVLLRGLPPSAPVAVVAIAPSTGTIYAGTGRGLYVGERGASLLERYDGSADASVQAVSPDPFRRRGVAVGTRTRGVVFSSDAGLTVETGAEQVPATEVFALARGLALDDLLVATDRGVFRSLPGTGVVVTAGAFKKLQRRWRSEPQIDDVARDAVAWNRLGGGVLGAMRARAGMAAWLPGVLLRYVYVSGRTSRRDEFLLRASDELPPFLDPANDTRDLFGNVGAFVIQPAQGAEHAVWLQLQWDLDRTVLADAEVVALRQGPQWWAAERAIIDRVQGLWSARRRLMSEAELAGVVRGHAGTVSLVERQLRIDELTAQLDALTGGGFSSALEQAASSTDNPDGPRRSRRTPLPETLEDTQEE